MRIWSNNTPRPPLQQNQPLQQKPKQNRSKVSSPAEKFVVVTNQTNKLTNKINQTKEKNLSLSDDSTAGSSICSSDSEKASVVTNSPKKVVTSFVTDRRNTADFQHVYRPSPRPSRTSFTTTSSVVDRRTEVLESAQKLLQTRGCPIRKQLVDMLREESARLLQAQVRGYLSRTRYQEQLAAAKFIQFYYREYKVRCVVVPQFLEQQMQAYLDFQQNTRIGASIMLQALARGGTARLSFCRQHPTSLYARRQRSSDAATKIQALWRGKSTRKRIKDQEMEARKRIMEARKRIMEQEYEAAKAAARKHIMEQEYEAAQVSAPPAATKTSSSLIPKDWSPSKFFWSKDKEEEEEEEIATPLHANKYMGQGEKVEDESETDPEDEDSDSDDSDSDSDSESSELVDVVAEVADEDDEDDEEFEDDEDDETDIDDDTYGEDVPIDELAKLEQEDAKYRQGWFNELMMDIATDFEDTWKEMTIAEPTKALEA